MTNFKLEIEELNRRNVHIKDIDRVKKIISELISGGVEKLQIVSDFDKTITKQHENGKKHLSSFQMFGKCPSVTEEYLQVTSTLTNKYVPIEDDPSIPTCEKSRLMEEWWLLSEMAMKGLKVSPEEIDEICCQLGSSLRDGTTELFAKLYAENVPVLVFSAGLGDTVVSVLKHCNVLLPNVEVVSNFLKYSSDGSIQGFRDRLIHVYNKNEYAIKGTEFYNKILERENVILLGDSLGDSKMAQGLDHLKSILKIGFLYERSEEALPSYMNAFDIVLEDDQTMDIPNAILQCITCKSAQL
ncbi:hypothetical protein NQ317_014527 [Molorchus minor]|uniref:5'-nucleotidase n=1 Tax=Molorchus minor TaxID=1323400 RepID=A0ABQ9JB82_9CUCU|nr:hypothetical protein NQ317_014527 [Molorchus minor]